MRLLCVFALAVPLMAGCAEELKMVAGGPSGNRVTFIFKGKIPLERIPEAWEMATKKSAVQLACTGYTTYRDTVYPVPTGTKNAEGEMEYQTYLGGPWQCQHEQMPGVPMAAATSP